MPNQKVARYLRLQLRENEYFHLDEVEIYGTPVKPDTSELRNNKDEATLEANFYRLAKLPPSPPPKLIPAGLVSDFTLENKIPVINAYYNNATQRQIYLSMEAYNKAFEELEKGSFKYYQKTLDYLLNAFDKYSVANKSVLVFGLVGVNCDAISIWKGAKDVYVIDYNLPISSIRKYKFFPTKTTLAAISKLM